MHYLDNASTTCVHPAVADVVDSVLREYWANPSALYTPGFEAEERISAARQTVALALGHTGPLDARRPELVFTAGGTEANNIAVLGAARARKGWGNHIVATGYEHPSVRRPLEHLEKNEGFTVTWIHPGLNGAVYAEELVQAVGTKTVLLCAMQMNNETGAKLDVAGIAAAVKERNSRTAVHVDAVQSFTKIPLNLSGTSIDTVALSGHKLHAPKGIGALYIRKGFMLEAPLYGGGQEGGIRPGTENTAFIAGFAKAVQLAQQAMEKDKRNISLLNLQLMAGLGSIGNICINSPEYAWPGILNISLPGIRSQTMLNFLDSRGVYLSSGASCDKGERSHTLTAMKLPDDRIDCALRVSMDGSNTPEDINALLDGLEMGIKTLQR